MVNVNPNFSNRLQILSLIVVTFDSKLIIALTIAVLITTIAEISNEKREMIIIIRN